jgi:hypothetical protein
MSRRIPDRLLKDRITIRKPVQSFVPSTRKPVFEFQTAAAGVKARFDPASSTLSRNVLGQTPKKAFKVFLNSTGLKENDEIVNESDGKTFVVTEVKDIFGHHMEAVVEEKK